MFSQSCERCHTLAAQGTRPLSGEKFWEGYTQKTVGDLLTFVKTNMPNGQGGSLPAATYNDLVALILKSNGFPAGKTELTPETIANVQIIPKDGPGELPGQHPRPRGRLPGAQERKRLDPDERDRTSSESRRPAPSRKTPLGRWATGL